MGSQNQVIICGGVLAPQVQASAGTFAADFLNQLNMDAAVFESEGFQASSGPTSSDLDYSQVQKFALQNARLRIVLAESKESRLFFSDTVCRLGEYRLSGHRLLS